MRRGTSIAAFWVKLMPEDPKPPRKDGAASGRVPLLDTVAERIAELSIAVAEQTERLLERPDRAPAEDLAQILEAARRSSELARELVTLARRERDAAAAALLSVTRGSAAPSERAFESAPARSHRRLRGDESRVRVILLVEDEPLLLKTLRRMLEQYGHRVLAASSAVEALALAAQASDVDLLVTDLALPGMAGNELAK